MRDLHCTISHGLSQALPRHHAMTGESIGHIIRAALAEYLQVSHSTLFQVSTSTALVQGVYQGAVRVGTLREHGDHGLGTFENIDGEMVVVDGHCFQVRSDGSVYEVADNVLSPFAAITRFVPQETVHLDACADLAQLMMACDRLRHSDNVFFAVRVDGLFDYVKTRAMCNPPAGIPLAVAAAAQPEFEFEGLAGTLVGFWTPEYAKTLNIPGYHLHFLSHDRQHGGHLLQCRARQLRLQIQREGQLSVALPETEAFLKADLRQDPSTDLQRAETDHTESALHMSVGRSRPRTGAPWLDLPFTPPSPGGSGGIERFSPQRMAKSTLQGLSLAPLALHPTDSQQERGNTRLPSVYPLSMSLPTNDQWTTGPRL